MSDGTHLDFDGPIITPSEGRIRRFADIPDVLSLELPPIEYIVPALGIARNTITLWTGTDGDGKTYMAQSMAYAVAHGDAFLGMRCQKSLVLYLDLENPAYVVQDRLRALAGEQRIPELRFWGIWNEQQPPQFGSELLLAIAKESKPLIIIDPFRYFHGSEENDSTAMSGVMQYLRACASYGCSVVLLHHPAKYEGSTGRGSSAIRGACDLAFLHSLDKESQMVTLKVDKNRNGETRIISIRANFEQGTFEMTDSPYITARNDELTKLERIIKDNPGITQNGIAKQSAMNRNRLARLLGEGRGTRWTTQPGPNKSKLYFAAGVVSAISISPETTDITTQGEGGVVSVVSHLKGDTTIPPTRAVPPAQKQTGRTLPSCPTCGSYALLREKDGSMTCQTCSGGTLIH
jgi:archaellum biogenesis ATPase FlaH